MSTQQDPILTVILVDSARYAFASQLFVLRSYPDVISRLLRNGKSVLLAAKVLVISRLLHTKLSQRPNPPPYLDTLRNRLAGLRRKLLSRIDRRFKSLELSRDVLVEAMCAFSLATSSSPKDVLRHYHHIRLEAITENMEEDSAGHENILLALRVYVKTLKDTQAVVPGQLAHALEKLKLTSLFKSRDVHSLIELNLDVYERWIGDDIRTFTPYIRHDDLSKLEAERSLLQWAKRAFSSFLDGLRNRIKDVQDPLALLKLRRKVLELWLSNHQHSLDIDTAETLNNLRDVFNYQSSSITKAHASTLADVGIAVQEILQNWRPGISDLAPSLWDPSMTSMEMSHGGQAFRESLMTRSTGKTESLRKVSKKCTAFLEGIDAVEEMIKRLRESKWADDVDDVDDDDDVLDNKQVLLSEDDPRLLQEELNNALHEAYASLQATLGNSTPDRKDINRGQKSIFLVRTWRELRQRLPKSYQNNGLGLNSIPTLQSIIADEALRKPLERCSNRIARVTATKDLLEKSLWEGEPPLPILPSAWTHRFLLDLTSAMTSFGSDIWTTQATHSLTMGLIKGIATMLEMSQETVPLAVNGRVNGEAGDTETKEPEDEDLSNGEGNNDGKQEKDEEVLKKEHVNGAAVNGFSESKAVEDSKDAKTQRLFDTLYLINVTARRETDCEENELIRLRDLLAEDVALEPKSVERMKKDAEEYWKRTSLLFALLA